MRSRRGRLRTLVPLAALAVAVTAVAVGRRPKRHRRRSRSPRSTRSPPVLLDGAGTNFLGSEVEPWIEVNPTDPDNQIAVYQQDRYSNGGLWGVLVGAVTFDGGATWAQVPVPTETRCTEARSSERPTRGSPSPTARPTR